MSKELLLVVETVSNEKSVSENVIFEALETAIEAATKKQYDEEVDIRVSISRATGDYETYRCYFVMNDDDIENPARELTLDEAIKIFPEAQIGGVVEERLENIPFGRIGAHLAKQIIIQKVREAERQKVFDEYCDYEGTIVHGVVKRIEHGNVILDLGSNVEGVIFKENTIPREATRVGDRVRAYISKVSRDNKGHQIILSRIASELLTELFKLEVPEISNGSIELKGAARDPGVRSKIAVHTNDPRIDAVGACIGMRGSRVQNITNELNGERVDIIVWKEDPAEFVMKSIAPAEPTSIMVDEERKSMDLSFPEDKLAIAVGRGGQNVRLASELTGWDLNLMTEEDFERKSGAEELNLIHRFEDKLDIDIELAKVLVKEGFSTVEEIAYIDINELYEIEEFSEETVDMLRERAKDLMLTQAIVAEEEMESGDVNLIDTLEGINDDLLLQLKLNDIHTWDDLAELSTDELAEMTGLSDEDSAALIMKARAPWFE